ncbi:hypothetical protein PR048_024934 [Dryococelus australis]|uniref:DUF5641 domain-containing protein n=1 Tax=Dryococelus australis TaxID=614101 RepID=A0ABQ9GQ02_9NEOP|nr:hypothetical protein PR048_024934 [Dryococelus australis]
MEFSTACNQSFWHWWHSYYFPHLQVQSQWTKGAVNVEPNATVIIQDSNLPLILFAGSLGATLVLMLVHVVQFYTSQGLVTPPMTKLCPLPNDPGKGTKMDSRKKHHSGYVGCEKAARTRAVTSNSKEDLQKGYTEQKGRVRGWGHERDCNNSLRKTVAKNPSTSQQTGTNILNNATDIGRRNTGNKVFCRRGSGSRRHGDGDVRPC